MITVSIVVCTLKVLYRQDWNTSKNFSYDKFLLKIHPTYKQNML